MSLADLFKKQNINEGVRAFGETPDALLIDVREAQEYEQGRIPRSVNVPLSDLNRIAEVAPSMDTPLFVYCTAGVRSKQAAHALMRAGYTQVQDIGGINDYQGELER